MPIDEKILQSYAKDVVDAWDMDTLVSYAVENIVANISYLEEFDDLAARKEIMDFYGFSSWEEVFQEDKK